MLEALAVGGEGVGSSRLVAVAIATAGIETVAAFAAARTETAAAVKVVVPAVTDGIFGELRSRLITGICGGSGDITASLLWSAGSETVIRLESVGKIPDFAGNINFVIGGSSWHISVD